MTELWWAYPLVGAVVGFLAGMLGVGGGLMIVPTLGFIFAAKGFPPQYVLHMALGTGIAVMLFTSAASTYGHQQHGAVRWDVLRHAVPGIILGTLAGSLLASHLNTRWLTLAFTGFVYFVAIRTLITPKPVATRTLPGRGGLFVAGAVVGALSSIAAIGGAALTVPYMVRCNVDMRHAIGTSAAIGFPIALAATSAYIATGWSAPLPQYSVGFVYLPALAGVALGTMLTAPLGARVSHRTPTARLRKIFVAVLLVLATRTLIAFF